MPLSIRRRHKHLSCSISHLLRFSKTGRNATQYPELATASINGPEAVGDKLKYEFVRAIGTKG